jgi:malate dehydrogenase
VVIGKNGVQKIVELEREKNDLDHLVESANGVKKTNSLLNL